MSCASNGEQSESASYRFTKSCFFSPSWAIFLRNQPWLPSRQRLTLRLALCEMKNCSTFLSKVLVLVCLLPGLGKAAIDSSRPLPAREPRWVFVAGPGTVVSVRFRDIPFIKPQYVVKFKTDSGELIEIFHHGASAPVVPGMRGTLVYSTHPDKVVTFHTLAAATD